MCLTMCDLLILFFQLYNKTKNIRLLFRNCVWLEMKLLLFSTIIMIYSMNKTTNAPYLAYCLQNSITFYCVSTPNCALVDHFEQSEIHLSCHKGTKRLSIRYAILHYKPYAGWDCQQAICSMKNDSSKVDGCRCGSGTATMAAAATEFLHSCWAI